MEPRVKRMKMDISKDVWTIVFLFLGISDILNLKLLCKTLKNIVEESVREWKDQALPLTRSISQSFPNLRSIEPRSLSLNHIITSLEQRQNNIVELYLTKPFDGHLSEWIGAFPRLRRITLTQLEPALFPIAPKLEKLALYYGTRDLLKFLPLCKCLETLLVYTTIGEKLGFGNELLSSIESYCPWLISLGFNGWNECTKETQEKLTESCRQLKNVLTCATDLPKFFAIKKWSWK